MHLHIPHCTNIRPRKHSCKHHCHLCACSKCLHRWHRIRGSRHRTGVVLEPEWVPRWELVKVPVKAPVKAPEWVRVWVLELVFVKALVWVQE